MHKGVGRIGCGCLLRRGGRVVRTCLRGGGVKTLQGVVSESKGVTYWREKVRLKLVYGRSTLPFVVHENGNMMQE